VAGSVVLPTISIVITPVCAPELIAEKAAFQVANEPAPGLTFTCATEWMVLVKATKIIAMKTLNIANRILTGL
jgi:hypothetical protein